MEDIRRSLAQIGFSEKEVSVYLACLEVGHGPVQAISKRSNVNRATCYHVLDQLCSKGLVTSCLEEGERRFTAEPPQRILTLLYLQQQEIEDRRKVADNLMLRLQAFHNHRASKPKIRYIESLAGLRTMQREYEELEEDIIQLIGYDTFLAIHERNASESHQRELAQRKRQIRSILVTDTKIAFPDDLNVEFVTISPSLIDVQGEMTVCGNRLVLFSFTRGIIAIEIESEVIAQTARATLELAWQQAKQLHRKNTPE